MTRPSSRRPPIAVFLAIFTLTLAASAAWAKDGHSLRDTAKQLVTAGFAGDLAAAKKLTLTPDQMSALSTRELDKAKYEKEVDEHLKDLKHAGPLPELRIEEVVYLPAAPTGKRKKEMVLAVVKPIFPDADQTERWQIVRGPFYFIQTDEGWRLSLKK